MLQTFVAAFSALVVRGPTVPESCADTRTGRPKATHRTEIMLNFIIMDIDS
jgi:hypothetical protein